MTVGGPLPRRRPAPLRPVFWIRVLGRVWTRMDEQNLSLLAAGCAFYGLLAVFPALAAAIAIWGLVADPNILRAEVDLLAELMPAEAFEIFSTQVDGLIATERRTLSATFLISLIIAVWSSRAGVAALIRGLNLVYGRPHIEGVFARLARILFLTVVLILMGLIALAAVLIVPAVVAFVSIGPMGDMFAGPVRWVTAVAAILIGLDVIYRFAPNRVHRRRFRFTPGAIAAVLVWVAGSVALTLYFQNFSNFNEVYGSIGAVMALLLWLYVSAFSVLLGAQLNVELARESVAAQRVRKKSTPPAESGER